MGRKRKSQRGNRGRRPPKARRDARQGGSTYGGRATGPEHREEGPGDRHDPGASRKVQLEAEGQAGTEVAATVMADRSVLLGQARIYWLFGEWRELVALHEDEIARDEERARLALLMASAFQRLDDTEQTRAWAQRAIDWGCEREEVASLLAAGVHNTLGRLALLSGDQEASERHFRKGVETAGLNETRAGTLARARASQEAAALGLVRGEDEPWHASQAREGSWDGTDREEQPDDFYRAFTERFRGAQETIQARVTVYLPFVHPVAARHPEAVVLDLGCGRGEWLEVLREAGISAHGVDTDPAMLAACREQGLSVEEGDAVAALERAPAGSLAAVSLLHLAEHLPFEALRRLVREAHRALVPEGLLIMETPNPENLTVGSCSFYMDPTHRNPLPPPLLAFVPEYYGFERVKILRLQEDPALRSQQRTTVADLLQGVSPDYAVAAQKSRPLDISKAEEQCWEQDYGIDFASLRQRLADD